jgi:hypothetical protein
MVVAGPVWRDNRLPGFHLFPSDPLQPLVFTKRFFLGKFQIFMTYCSYQFRVPDNLNVKGGSDGIHLCAGLLSLSAAGPGSRAGASPATIPLFL